MFHPKTFYSVLTPMFYVAKIFGLSPFQINSECYKKSKLNMSCSILLMVSAYIYTVIFLLREPAVGNSILTKVPELANSHLSPSSMFVYILFGCIFSNKVLNSLKNINVFDKEMKDFLQVNLEKEYRKSKIYLIIGLLTMIIHLLISFTFTAIINNSLQYFLRPLLLFVCPTVTNAIVGFQFCTLALLLKQRFQWLNKKIITVFINTNKAIHIEESQEQFLYKINNEKGPYRNRTIFNVSSTILETIRIKHHFLCIICSNINTAYSVQILFMILRSFVSLITGLFYLGRLLIFVGYIDRQYLVYSIIQLSLAVVQLVALTVVCSSTTSEAQKVGALIHNTSIMSSQLKGQLKRQLSFFSLQLLHQNTDFTACRIVVVNENLLLMVAGAVSTYLVIVIQFQMQDFKHTKQKL